MLHIDAGLECIWYHKVTNNIQLTDTGILYSVRTSVYKLKDVHVKLHT